MTTATKTQPNNIIKTASLIEFKTITEGDGGFKGYPSTTGFLDDVGDIIPPNAYANLTELAGAGWVCGDHEWGVEDEVGLILTAKEDSTGLFIEAEFHSDAKSQAIRQKVQKRLERGKKVFMSIGYRPTAQPLYVYPNDYATALPKYLKPQFLKESLAKARQFERVRILPKIEVYEASIVSKPANTSAEITAVKSATSTKPERLSYWTLMLREHRQMMTGYQYKKLCNVLTEQDDRELRATLYGLEALAWEINDALKDSPFEKLRLQKAKREKQKQLLQAQLKAMGIGNK